MKLIYKEVRMLIVRRKKKVVGTQFREHEQGAGITLKVMDYLPRSSITIRCDNIRQSLRIIKQLRHLALTGTLIERGKKHQSKTDGELHFKSRLSASHVHTTFGRSSRHIVRAFPHHFWMPDRLFKRQAGVSRVRYYQ